jgi:hypothetical protein
MNSVGIDNDPRGIFTSFVLELVVYPAIYEIWKWHGGLKQQLALTESTPGVSPSIATAVISFNDLSA